MKTIVITAPRPVEDEAARIVCYLDGRADIVHIRKPGYSPEELARLIESIPSRCYSRLVLHDHHELALRYGLYGVHLNGRNPAPPAGWCGSVSRSCHSMVELALWKPSCSYVSLSPIFDSISKQGYLSAFTPEELRRAHLAGLIDEKVCALGGVTFDRIDQVARMGFGGAMILGDAWPEMK